MMSHGQVIASGSVTELLASRTTGDVRIRLADPQAGPTVLQQAGFTVTPLEDSWRVGGVTDPSAVTRTLSEAGLHLTELTPIAWNRCSLTSPPTPQHSTRHQNRCGHERHRHI